MKLWKDGTRMWREYGWYLLLGILLVTFVVLFILNTCSSSDPTSSISWQDIYEYFISMCFRPAVVRTPPRKSSSIRGGSSKGEISCKQFIEFYFQKPFVKVRPDFLKNPVTQENLELDLYNEELHLAVEYNGSQHYQYNSFMHKQSRDRFQNQQYRDLIKRDLCKKAGITLVIVPYTIEQDDIPAFLFEEFQRIGMTPHPYAMQNQ